MRRISTLLFVLVFVLFRAGAGIDAQTAAARTLAVYVIDVEGGQATLVVSPSGESMLIDTGWPGFDGRDPDRIQAAMKQAGVSRIDYLLITHYHTDHVGGVPALAAKVPIGTFIDHGATVEKSDDPGYTAYLKTREHARHLQTKPGETIPLRGVNVTVVSSAGETLPAPLAGAGTANPLCADYKPQPDDPSENARSVGVLIGYGAFRMLDLGDLTWNKEHELACPSNKIGSVDLYLTTHHGNQQSGPPALIHALKPRVAIMNNGVKKGGSPAAWRIVRESPGLQDLWQLHVSAEGGHDANTAEQFIANLDETTSNAISVSAQQDGRFTVTNGRNHLAKTYGPGSTAKSAGAAGGARP